MDQALVTQTPLQVWRAFTEDFTQLAALKSVTTFFQSPKYDWHSSCFDPLSFKCDSLVLSCMYIKSTCSSRHLVCIPQEALAVVWWHTWRDFRVF